MLWLILLLENDLFILLFVKNLNTTDGQNKKFTNLKRILGGTEAVRARQAAVVCWWWLAASSLLLSALETEFWHAATHALPAYRSQIKGCVAVYAVTHTSAVSCELTYACTNASTSRSTCCCCSYHPFDQDQDTPAIQAWSSKLRPRQFCFFASQPGTESIMQWCKDLLLPATTDHPQFLTVTSFRF